ncbi:DEAD/DEAH box helicase [Bartonella sp. DGB1]|uniref:DEAD/DEAH box helicase n=1 Tax=Bartonella sp. DGB1 TaxID=3239807 RepID=UPI0035232EA5
MSIIRRITIKESEDCFSKFNFNSKLLHNLQKVGFHSLKDIQKQAIPLILAGKDIVAVAQTGSGKTAAFCLPIINNLLLMGAKRKEKTSYALILVPTRELAMQIENDIKSFINGTHLSLTLMVGGISKIPQIKKISTGTDILVATPGRLLDLLQEQHVKLDEVNFLVLDEADRMLDMGFIPDILKILKYVKKDSQKLLFSATMPTEIVKLSKQIVKQAVYVEVSPQGSVKKTIEQKIYYLPHVLKKQFLAFLLSKPSWKSIIIFVRTKYSADGLARILAKYGFNSSVIHGNKSQKARQDNLNNFKNGLSRILIATDIVARGIDIAGVDLVINYDLPDQADNYVHRIGRTARNEKSGVAITLCDLEKEKDKLIAIEKLIKEKIKEEKIPEEFSVKVKKTNNRSSSSRKYKNKKI